MRSRTLNITVYIDIGGEEFTCEAKVVNYTPEDPGCISGPLSGAILPSLLRLTFWTRFGILTPSPDNYLRTGVL